MSYTRLDNLPGVLIDVSQPDSVAFRADNNIVTRNDYAAPGYENGWIRLTPDQLSELGKFAGSKDAKELRSSAPDTIRTPHPPPAGAGFAGTVPTALGRTHKLIEEPEEHHNVGQHAPVHAPDGTQDDGQDQDDKSKSRQKAGASK